MSDRREASAGSPDAGTREARPAPASDRERVLLLECRLEQSAAAVAEARAEADRARNKLAEAASRETEHARRFCLIHEELAEARAEIALLHRHLERSEALRSEIAGHLFEGGARDDTEELMRLRRKALAEDQRALVSDRTVARLRERVEELVSSRETLLTRIAEWQQLIREDGPEAADLSEFLAELRREILDLEHRSATSDAREARLREQLASAGIDPDREAAEPEPAVVEEPEPAEEPEPVAAEPEPEDVEPAPEVAEPAVATDEVQAEPDRVVEADAAVDPDPAVEPAAVAEPAATVEPEPPAPAPPATPVAHAEARTDALVSELLDARLPELRADLLLRLGRTGDASAVETIRPWAKSSEPSVRAAAYEALGRLLERDPEGLEPHLRAGLSDEDARVRRRVVLATTTARGLDRDELLDPLREDPDPQVRRLIRQVLRRPPSFGPSSDEAHGTPVPSRTSRV